MQKIVLYDNKALRLKLLPLTYTRSIADIRFGMTTMMQKWAHAGFDVYVATEDYLNHELQTSGDDIKLFIDASIYPNESLITELKQLSNTESLKIDMTTIAFKGNLADFLSENYLMFKGYKLMSDDILKINQISDLFIKNERAIIADYDSLTANKTSGAIDETSTLIGDNIFLGTGAQVTTAIINTTDGPVYIDENALVMEGAMLRGPLYVGKNAVVKMGAKIYGATTIGPYCKVGGEISNSVLMGYSNKGHDGFLGNSILGEWCNLGADTNTSNLKNNYGNVKTYSYEHDDMMNTGLIFHGLIMGDHSKSGINTMFNTGTVVGVCSNIFGGGFPKKFIPSFSWGGGEEFVDHELDKAISTAKAVYTRRKKTLSQKDKDILNYIFEFSSKYRT